ncbi:MAG: GreA/GreB family elongation factor [Bacteroidota bacterium]
MDKFAEIKTALHLICLSQLEIRLQEIESRLDSIQASRENESKSSVGDKYETGRAMLHLEQEKAQSQLSAAQVDLQKLTALKPEVQSSQIIPGSLVFTPKANYYLAIGLGKIEFQDQVFFCASAASPIGQALLGKKVGDEFVFNGQLIQIQVIA